MEGKELVWSILGGAGLVIITLMVALLIQALLLRTIQDALAQRADALTHQQTVSKRLMQEYREVYSALRAERAHVEQLQRKVLLIQDLLTDYLSGVAVSF
ncbi:hypothetical protein [Pseudomonas nunensis]|uniref:Uncharacterized protein n=1 Tax=Pseudomonas nunensis TaxID=2961896 RepID=A0ABY5E7L0_9PSED|nr:hypothetical protein [Pseudomonas nunensis]KPN91558.1 hypothetical protein AL066_14895 [Pseudomonas nunensis]MCL5229753.1 hypothetical protein [Pseudomonas nunensis]UTO11761.1 hypothetical protein NK667_16315 [Pseudomonas nunensis]